MPPRILPFKPAAPKPAKKPTRVLIVDDEEAMRHFVETVLRSGGYETTTAADGDEAIAIAARAAAPFDLLVTDEMMPRMAGHQLARYMRELYLNIKVLYLSGYTDDAVVRHGIIAADHHFLQKPFTPTELAVKVRLVLDL